MAEVFDTVEADPGSGGAKIAGDTFTQSAVSKFVPCSYLVYGAAGGPYERVDTATPLPVTVISSALPSGASTAAKQPALGTAGTASTDVLTVQGIASMTPLLATVTFASAQAVTQSGTWTVGLSAGTNNIGDVDVLTVPADPFGANADAASATGSISAKLRFIAATGIPITGTVTVGSHAVTNAGVFVVQIDGIALTRLTDIETNTDSGAVVGNGAAATAQRVTLANDSTGIVALTTSTASIGKLAANSGVDIGDVDVTSVIPGVGATNLGKAIDTATGATNTGVLALATRTDALSSITPADGDNTTLRVNSNGALWITPELGSIPVTDGGSTLTVDAPVGTPVFVRLSDGSSAIATLPVSLASVPSHAVTNAGTFVVQENGAALTALQIIDDWDESDRCKTNPIVGQAGVAAGAGAVAATVQRVTLASDDPAVVDLAALEALIIGTLRGAATPVIDSYTSKSISAAANTADQELVAAPGANKQIWVYGFVGTADTADGSISLQDSDNTAASGVMPVIEGGGFVVNPSGNFAMPWLKIATNKALEIDTVTCGFKGSLSYAIVSV